MEENQSRVRRKGGSHNHETSRTRPTKKIKNRWPDDDTGDPIECSGKYCRSCTGGVIADCVAVCCCPCAVINFLALAFVKAPWMIGRKCFGLVKKKRKKKKKKRRCKSESESVGEGNGNSRNAGEGTLGIELGVEEEEEKEDEDEKNRLSAKSEADKVWFELYQLGHLGFGRVSFTGIQSQGMGNYGENLIVN